MGLWLQLLIKIAEKVGRYNPIRIVGPTAHSITSHSIRVLLGFTPVTLWKSATMANLFPRRIRNMNTSQHFFLWLDFASLVLCDFHPCTWPFKAQNFIGLRKGEENLLLSIKSSWKSLEVHFSGKVTGGELAEPRSCCDWLNFVAVSQIGGLEKPMAR